jgi:hypothetical protein
VDVWESEGFELTRENNKFTAVEADQADRNRLYQLNRLNQL